MKNRVLLSLFCTLAGQSAKAMQITPYNQIAGETFYNTGTIQEHYPNAFNKITTEKPIKLGGLNDTGWEFDNQLWAVRRSSIKTSFNMILASLTFWGASKFFDTRAILAGFLGLIGLNSTKNLVFGSKYYVMSNKINQDAKLGEIS